MSRSTSGALALAALLLGHSGCGRLGFDGDDASPPPPGARDVRQLPDAPGEFVTESRSFVDVPGATLTIPASPQPYLVLASARLGSSSTAADTAEARLVVGDVEHAASGVDNEVAYLGGAWLHVTAVPASTQPTTVSVQARDLTGVAKIETPRLIAVALGDAELQSEWIRLATAPTNAWQPIAKLAVATERSGPFLVLGEATGREAPCIDEGVGVRVIDSSGATWPAVTAAFPNRNTSYQGVSRTTRAGFFFARRVDVTAGTPLALELQAKGGIPSGCEITHARLIAFRADVFADARSTQDIAELTTEAERTTSKLDLALAARYLVVQSVVMSAIATGRGDRVARFLAGGVPQAEYLHAMDNENYRVPYGAFYVLDVSAPTTLETRVSSGTLNMSVAAKESVILALGL